MIRAIILAAGQSKRMGTQKLLMPFGSSTVIARIADSYLDAAVDSVHVVLSPSNQSIAEALGNRPVHFVINESIGGDMLSSVRCGLRSIPPETTGVFISTGDQPSLDSSIIHEMIQTFLETKNKIVVPVCNGIRGHPLLLAQFYIAEVLSSFDGIGLRGLLVSHPNCVHEWITDNSAVIEDMDTLQDYQQALARSGFAGIYK